MSEQQAYFEKETRELYAAMGRCIANWAMVEHYCCLLYSEILSAPPQLAEITWASVVSFEAKLSALSNVLGHASNDNELKDIWKKLSNKISSYHKKRNEIAHATVVYGQDKVCLVPFYTIGVFKKNLDGLSAAQLTERAEKFSELSNAVSWFIRRALCDKAQIEDNLPPEPHLISRIRETISQSPLEGRPFP